MMIYFNAIQGASLIATHGVATKLLLSLTLRVYQFLEPDPKRRQTIENNPHVQRFQAAQRNESEYLGILVALLLFYSTSSSVDVSLASTLAVVGQIGYVWTRTLFGYPKIPAIVMAVTRYSALVLLCLPLYQSAFVQA